MRVFGEHLDFDLISRKLGVQPSHAHRKGEIFAPGAPPFAHDLWSVDAPVNRAETLDKHLLSLRQMLEPRYDFLRSLKGQAQLRSFCGIISDGHECAFRLSPEALRIFTRLDIDMEVSLIFLCLDTEETIAESIPPEPKSQEPAAESQSYRTESRVSLQITADASDLRELSEGLDVPIPDRERLADGSPVVPVGNDSHWAFKCPLPPTDKLDLHIRWLAEILLARMEILGSFRPRVELFVRCDFATESDTGGVGISPQALKLCTEIGVPLELRAQLV
jgi:hypothetical protein